MNELQNQKQLEASAKPFVAMVTMDNEQYDGGNHEHEVGCFALTSGTNAGSDILDEM